MPLARRGRRPRSRAGRPVVEIETDKATVEIEAPSAGSLRIVAAEGAIVAGRGRSLSSSRGRPQRGGADGRGAPRTARRRGRRRPRRRRRPRAGPRRRVARREPPRPPASPRPRLGGSPASAASTSRRCSASGPGGRIVARDVAEPAPRRRRRDRLRAAVGREHRRELAADPARPHRRRARGGGRGARAGVGPAASRRYRHRSARRRARTCARGRARAQRGARPDGPWSARRGRTSRSPSRPPAASSRRSSATPASLSLADVARERRRLVEAARQGTLDGRDLAGGTCTLSNLGAYPVDFFAPVVSGPQVAMVATGRVAEKAVAIDGMLGVRPTHVGERRHRPPRRRRRGGRSAARRIRTSTRAAPRRLRMTITPVPVDEAVPGPRPGDAGDDALLALYRQMVRVRAFEEEVIDAFAARASSPARRIRASAPRGSRPAHSPRCGPTTSCSRPTAATARR